jgi:hypothetical protein
MNKDETIQEFIKEVLDSETFPNIAEYKKAERLIEIGAKWQEGRMYPQFILGCINNNLPPLDFEGYKNLGI